MFSYIVFGAGETGKKACYFLGWHRVYCFASNTPSEITVGKKVISFQEMEKIASEKKHIVVIASEKYAIDMIEQIKKSKIKLWFRFYEADIQKLEDYYTGYWLYGRWFSIPYNKRLSDYNINQYKKILIYGTNFYLPYLISEICVQNDLCNIKGIVQTEIISDERLMNLPICEFDQICDDIDCIVINVHPNKSPIIEILTDKTDHVYKIIDMYNVDFNEEAFEYEELKKYKNLYKGQRGFVIGNGPSLSIRDLEILHENNEICIATNKIYRVYSETNWRADYIGISDKFLYPDIADELLNIPGDIFVSDDNIHMSTTERRDYLHYYHQIYEEFYPFHPGFSDDITKGFYGGWTIVYNFGIQFAAYLGLSEIYLLGVDNNFSKDVTDEKNHFIKNYHKEGEREKYRSLAFSPHVEEINLAYERADSYSKAHGFRIYNATRGGKLEAFERVDFDSLFDIQEE